MIHYHGTPITPIPDLMAMRGRHFCVSFVRDASLKRCLQIGQSIMYDNGAYAHFNKSKVKPFTYEGYLMWLEPMLAHPHWCVIPDKIDGTEAEERALLKKWPLPVDMLSAPVWHMNTSLDYLLYLTDHYPRICLGGTPPGIPKNAAHRVNEAWVRRMDETFNALVQKRKRLPWLHGLRMTTSVHKHNWPLASVDSANIARNHNDDHACPGCMARNIDSRQSALCWKSRKLDGFFK